MALACFVGRGLERAELLATALDDGRVQLWDTATSTLRHQLTRPTHLAVRWTSIAAHAGAAGGKAGGGRVGAAVLLALGSDGGVVALWDVQRAALVHELRAHSAQVNAVAFGSSGRTLLSAGEDKQVCCWDPVAGTLLQTFKTGKVPVASLAHGADDAEVLLAATWLRLVRRPPADAAADEAGRWKRLARFPGHASAVSCLCVSSDGAFALSSADDRHVSLWRLRDQHGALVAQEKGGAPASAAGTLSLAHRVTQLCFRAAPPAATNGGAAAHSPEYAFCAVTADGSARVWRFGGGARAKKRKGSKKGEENGTADAPLGATPACVLRVAADGGEPTAEPSQRIRHVSWCGPDELLVSYGSAVAPTFTQCALGGVESVELPRVSTALLAADDANGTGAKRKRRTAEPVQEVGAMDMALPAARTRGAVGAAAAPADEGAAAADAGREGVGAEAEEEDEEDDEGGGPSFGELVERSSRAKSARAAPAPSASPASALASKKPTPASQVALLVQALQNGDGAMLEQALQAQDAHSVTATIARLPVSSLLPLLEALLARIQGKPARVATLACWLRALLSQHAAYLMSCSQLLPMLTPLYQLLDERLAVFKPLLKLVGRMQMLQSQIASQASGRLEGAAAETGPLGTYDEAEEEADEGEEGEEEEGDGEEDDDDEDDDEFDDDDDDEYDDMDEF